MGFIIKARDKTSYEKKVYSDIKDNLDMSEEEFLKDTSEDKQKWITAYNTANKLHNSNPERLFEGYRLSGMYTDSSDSRTFNISMASSIVHSAIGKLEQVNDVTQRNIGLEQFVLFGDRQCSRLYMEAFELFVQHSVAQIRALNKCDYRQLGEIQERGYQGRNSELNQMIDNYIDPQQSQEEKGRKK